MPKRSLAPRPYMPSSWLAPSWLSKKGDTLIGMSAVVLPGFSSPSTSTVSVPSASMGFSVVPAALSDPLSDVPPCTVPRCRGGAGPWTAHSDRCTASSGVGLAKLTFFARDRDLDPALSRPPRAPSKRPARPTGAGRSLRAGIAARRFRSGDIPLPPSLTSSCSPWA